MKMTSIRQWMACEVHQSQMHSKSNGNLSWRKRIPILSGSCSNYTVSKCCWLPVFIQSRERRSRKYNFHNHRSIENAETKKYFASFISVQLDHFVWVDLSLTSVRLKTRRLYHWTKHSGMQRGCWCRTPFICSHIQCSLYIYGKYRVKYELAAAGWFIAKSYKCPNHRLTVVKSGKLLIYCQRIYGHSRTWHTVFIVSGGVRLILW